MLDIHQEAKRTVHHADAIHWLRDRPILDGCSIIASMPDISEFPKMNLQEWKTWFTDTAALVLSRCPDQGLALFFQTDIKRDGVWVDKGFLCQKAAELSGHELVAHKIICRAPAGITTFGRPSYSHLLCFSKSIRPEIAESLADVLPAAGETTWARGMGVKACELACKMVLKYTDTHTIVNPFCGHGTVLAVANSLGLSAIGIEHSLKRAKKAEAQTLTVAGSDASQDAAADPPRFVILSQNETPIKL